MVLEIAAATLLVAWVTYKARLSLVLPYVWVAVQFADWLSWGVVTMLYFAMLLYAEVQAGVAD